MRKFRFGLPEMLTIHLPPKVFEDQIPRFLDELGEANEHESIAVDFAATTFLIPASVVSLLSSIHQWLNTGKSVEFRNCSKSAVYQYLQRMNFFDLCGLDLPESFRRRNPEGRFVPIHRIGQGGSHSADQVATSVAKCIDPDGEDEIDPEKTGSFDYLQYAVSELATNVVQHSNAFGFIAAQFNASSDTVRVAIADCGIGILQSFHDAGSPHWNDQMDDLAAIHKACEARVSSKNHLSSAWGAPINAGVGLTLLKEAARQTGGSFAMASGTGYHSLVRDSRLSTHRRLLGTLCAMSFRRSRVTDFTTILRDAKLQLGLLKHRDAFRELFE